MFKVFTFFQNWYISISQCIHVLLKQSDSRKIELLYLSQFFLSNLPYFIFKNLPQGRFYFLNKGWFEFLNFFFNSGIEFICDSSTWQFEIKIKLTDINHNSWYNHNKVVIMMLCTFYIPQ